MNLKNRDVVCSLTNKNAITVNELSNFIYSGLKSKYGNADDEGMVYDSEMGGHYGAEKFDTYDLLYEEAPLDCNSAPLIKDIISEIGNQFWCHIDPYSERENQQLRYNWKLFKNVILHKARYVFFKTTNFDNSNANIKIYDILDEIGRRVEKLIYPSSRNILHPACVLFYDHNESLNTFNLIDIQTIKPGLSNSAQ